MNPSRITPVSLRNVMLKKGYVFFENDTKPYNLNLIGIRTNNTKANSFDDWYTISWKYRSVWNLRIYPCTTDPGIYWLQKLLNPSGCAILVPGQYRNVYMLDLHLGKYQALCQRLGPVKVYRDKNKDAILDLDPKTIDVGNFGINHHHAGAGVASAVYNASAGCQVFQKQSDFFEARSIWNYASNVYGNKFTYTLLTEADFE